MKIIKSIIAAAVLSAAAMSTAQAELRLGLDSAPYEPFYARTAGGEWKGFEIEVGEALCKAMNEECVWVPIAWDGIIPALTSNKIDAIVASMSITEERMKTIDFSNKYYNTPAALIAPKASEIKSLDDLKGKTVGVQVSTTHANFAEAKIPGATVKTYQDFNEHNQDLFAGRVDAIVADSLALEPFLKSKEGEGMEVKLTLKDEAIFGLGVGAGVRKADTELKDKFNKAIAQILEDGTYDEIAKKYFAFDIYGGAN
ncbi:transporter substrate-binding domain-containing protein [Ahrensia sp. R2A130]|uniref:transporter substrate-binding domain-containing protein n=1 Tax=Ahrensia sp. R2A130 TaxID=744979 RepID=UPI0001E0ACAC|nr:transporter substrate-binding domain-containing protein [Ahrensia sp. R2A130]EFL88667.1 histidine ABC transporter, periplasmic histidine-binding protein HisJ [Ahrensia sp. R2A130]